MVSWALPGTCRCGDGGCGQSKVAAVSPLRPWWLIRSSSSLVPSSLLLWWSEVKSVSRPLWYCGTTFDRSDRINRQFSGLIPMAEIDRRLAGIDMFEGANAQRIRRDVGGTVRRTTSSKDNSGEGSTLGSSAGSPGVVRPGGDCGSECGGCDGGGFRSAADCSAAATTAARRTVASSGGTTAAVGGCWVGCSAVATWSSSAMWSQASKRAARSAAVGYPRAVGRRRAQGPARSPAVASRSRRGSSAREPP